MTTAEQRHAPLGRSLAAVTGVLALFGAVGVAVVLPWQAAGDVGGDVPAGRYAMFEDGHASLLRRTDADGSLIEWQSLSVEVLPGLRALSDLPDSFRDAVAAHVSGDDESSFLSLENRDDLARARVGLVAVRRLQPDGTTATDHEVQVLDRDGLHSLGVGSDAGEELLFEPALPLLPPNPEDGSTWTATGTFAGTTTYTFEAEIIAVGPADTTLGRLTDCVTVESELVLEGPDGTDDLPSVDVYCAGAGWVHGERPADGESFDAVSVRGHQPAELPAVADLDASSSVTLDDDPEAWELVRVGSALPLISTGHSTFPPVYLPTDPPSVLAATEASGDLVALAAGAVSGSVAWRFPTSGAVYSPPRYDADRHRLYVGASDGVLRAIDARGLFLWAAEADDNIATRPVVAGDTVVFGSEDGYVYGVDADTGERRWRVEADGAVVSSPALAGDRVVVADESGAVRALDPETGTSQWSHTTAGTVEAPIGTTADGDLLVADRTGVLTLLADDGSERWTADAGDAASLRTEPVVAGDLVVTIADDGDMAATTLDDGTVVWRRDRLDYVGAPAAVGDVVVAVRSDGTIDVLDRAGTRLRQLDARAASTPTDLPASFSYGPAVGGGALWLADDHGIVRRLGMAATDTGSRLEVAWVKTTLDAPYSTPLVSTPLLWDDRLVLIDPRRNVFAVDPATGDATTLGTFGTDADTVLPEGVVAAGILVVDAGTRLIGWDLATATELWSHPMAGQRSQPPAIADGVVVAVTEDGDTAAIEAVDLVTGELLWREPTGRAALRGGPLVDGDVVIAGDPVAAFDVRTGERRWTAEVANAVGLPAVVDGTLVLTTYTDGDDSGRIAGVDVATGGLRFERETPGDGHGPPSRLLAVDGVAVLTSLSGPILGIDPATGDERWRTSLPSPPIGMPSAIGDAAWYALDSGQVVALEPVEGEVAASFEGFGTSISALSLVQRPAAAGDTVVVAAGPAVFAVREATR